MVLQRHSSLCASGFGLLGVSMLCATFEIKRTYVMPSSWPRVEIDIVWSVVDVSVSGQNPAGETVSPSKALAISFCPSQAKHKAS